MRSIGLLCAVIAVVSSGASVFLMARQGYLPLWLRLISASETDGRKYYSWSDELFLGWSEEETRRIAVWARVAAGGVALVTLVITGSIVFALGLGCALYFAPGPLYRYALEKRRKLLDDQLPDAVSLMVASVRAGNALSHAIEEVSRKMPAPIGQEFGLIAREHTLGGLSIEDALARTRDRLGVESFTMLSSALIINCGQGGDLLHILERMADATRSLSRLQKKIVTETSEIRAQQKIILVMTPLFGGLICLFDSSIPHILFHSFIGNVLLLVVAALQLGCVAWIRSIVRTTI